MCRPTVVYQKAEAAEDGFEGALNLFPNNFDPTKLQPEFSGTLYYITSNILYAIQTTRAVCIYIVHVHVHVRVHVHVHVRVHVRIYMLQCIIHTTIDHTMYDVFIGKMLVLDCLLAVTRSTSDDKVYCVCVCCTLGITLLCESHAPVL